MGVKKLKRAEQIVSFTEQDFRQGQRREHVRQKYAHLSIRKLRALSTDLSVQATEVHTLLWERLWTTPSGN